MKNFRVFLAALLFAGLWHIASAQEAEWAAGSFRLR
jgi:hypothetical protein